MTAIPKEAFDRALASLDREEFVAFLAALWAARGYRTDRGSHPGVVVASHPDRHEEMLYVPEQGTSRRWSTGTVDLPDSVDRESITVVVPDTATPNPGAGVSDCVGAESLYELAMYAIDREDLADLCRTHFGASPATLAAEDAGRGETRLRRTVRTLWTEAGRRQRVTTLVVGVLSVLLATALVWAGGSGLGPNADASPPDTATGTGDAESVPTAIPDPADTPEPGDTPGSAGTPDPVVLESPCPDPPTGVSPGDLRPHPESDALEGWQVADTYVVSVFDLMNRSRKATPEESFVGTYVGPDGRAYELRISRWDDPATARGEALDRRARWPVREVWGAYSFGVRGANGTVPSTSLARAAARELLVAIETPSGDGLATCVDDLVEDRG